MSDVLAITVPYGAQPGQRLKASTDDGRMFFVKVPEGARPGMTLMVNVPAPPAPGAPPSQEPAEAEEPKLIQSGTTATEGVDQKDLCACVACCCTICSCYPKFPECIGCHQKNVVACLEFEAVMCKTGRTEGSLCMCIKQECEIVKPTTCVKGTSQFFCVDARCAFPCDDEVPCMVSALGCTFVKNYECICKAGASVGETTEGGAPEANEMER